MDIGRVGVWLAGLVREPAARTQEAAAEIEELGYGALWYPEALGTRECFATGALLLAGGRRLTVATGIANLWARDAITMAAGAATLGEAYPGRFLLGIGVSHVEQVGPHGLDYRRPISTMRAYLDRMDAAPFYGARPDPPVERLLAALRPRMIEVARERRLGIHPYFVPPEHSRRARELLGPGLPIATEQACVLETDPADARAIARNHMEVYLSRENYVKNLLWLGYSEADLADGGSDGLVDDIVAWGDEAAIRRRVDAHLDAGADHVCVQPLVRDGSLPLEQLRALAPALLG